MDEMIFEMYGRAIMAAFACALIMKIAMWFVFGDTVADGQLAQYMYSVLDSWLQG